MQTQPIAQDSTPVEIISVDAISKSFTRGSETVRVLDNLSLKVNKGAFIALMGPSGSGKTTLLNLIAGIDRPDSGTVTVASTNVGQLSEAKLTSWRATNVGFIFQFYNLIPVLTAIENVALPLSLIKMSKKEQQDRAKFALDLVGLSDRYDHFPSQLSGGQEQRVAIARAVVTDPTIIVADEPTGDLDRQSAKDIMALLSRLNREFNKTIVMVTHDQAAADYAKQIIHLDKGKLVG